MAVTSTWPGGFMFLYFLCPGAPVHSTGSGPGLKHLRGPGGISLKSHLTDWWSLGSNSPPLGTKEVTYLPHHTGSLTSEAAVAITF